MCITAFSQDNKATGKKPQRANNVFFNKVGMFFFLHLEYY
ncbi:hypothetical protein HMPREF9151_00749 [Hoylesella saccharolytica F0055]|uniref:Uncharacterized protein n=1 Tax=Hoylesella saccharolytica F0055 TaxID=1127699 RepID=L1NH39_9BACT|nr:hypothetical protein HMPREF9151_00749 [Hoylesella saccharolytica F0055]